MSLLTVSRLLLRGVFGLLLGGALLCPTLGVAEEVGAAPRSTPAESPLGRKIPHFLLANPEGQQVSLYDFKQARVIAVTFLNTACPVSNQYLAILNELSEKYRDQPVQFVAINSHAGDTPEAIARHAQEYGLKFTG